TCVALPNFLTKEAPYKGPGADSEEKREPVSDMDIAVADSLKVLDLKRPIREATEIARRCNMSRRATNRLRRRQFKAVWQHDQDKILPFWWMARDVPFPVCILDEDRLSSGDTSYLSVARFKLDLAIQP